MFEDVLRFWLDRGVDGFRVDVAHGLVKEDSLRDQVVAEGETPASGQVNTDHSMVSRELKDEPMWDQPEVHDVYRAWHRVLDEAGADKMAVAEAWTQTPESTVAFVRPDELDQAFNFAWLLADWSAEAFAKVITSTLEAVAPVGASPTWVLSNHDVVRHVTRYGGGEQGLARGRAATLAMLALPGSSYLYQGEELGLEQVDVAPEDRQDPSYLRTGEVGRDGCRVPIPWGGDAAPYDFGPSSDAAVDPAAGRLVVTDRGGAGQGRRLDAGVLPPGAGPAARLRVDRRRGGRDARPGPGRPRLPARPVHRRAQLRAAPVELPAGEVLIASGPVGRLAAGGHRGLAVLIVSRRVATAA